ncbi:type VII secretion protein EccB [Gordonia sihwensis]|uniref:type VII secretion protein EccB n=1 Tax=Gordonia sihwensis TaxID=173559 RepID=UPI003D962F34
MARRYLTTQVQRSGYVWMMRRLTRAFGRRDVRDIDEPLTKQGASYRYGWIAIALIGIAAFVVSMLMPAGKAGTATFVTLKSGGRYVMYDGQWHSVPNLASARLILNEPADAKKVDEKELRSAPLGPPMGIAFAPDSLTVASPDHPRWSVCSAQEPSTSMSSASKTDLTTTVVGGTALSSRAHDVRGTEGVLVVTPEDKDTHWLLFRGHRAIVSDDSEVWNALGISEDQRDNATVVSRALLNTIPEYDTIDVPELDRMGLPSGASSRWNVGTVLRSQVGNQATTYVVADDGVQVINETIARLLINAGAEEFSDAPMSLVSRLKTVSHLNPAAFPSAPPLLLSRKSVCSTWEKDGTAPEQFTLSVSEELPLEQDQRPVDLLPATGATLSADQAYFTPGDNWLVHILGGESDSTAAGSQRWFITPNGTRYAIGAGTQNADPFGALGFEGSETAPIPWSVASLLTQGATLSFANALVFHDQAFDSPNIKPAPREGGE